LPEEKRVETKKDPSTRESSEANPISSTKIDVFVLRHGQAGNRMAIVEEDAERPLTPAGRAEIQKVARALRSSGLKADRVCTSPLRRARETAEIAARILKISRSEEWNELKPDGNRASLYRKLSRLERGSRIMLVGHEPYLSSLIGEITGTPGTRIVLKKGGLGKIRINSFSPKVSGELRWLLTPKIMTRMS